MSSAKAPVLPPGTMLQHRYLRRRLRRVPPGRFLEVGTGRGTLSRVLVEMGWRGEGWELDEESVCEAEQANADAIRQGRLEVHQGNWLEGSAGGPYDLVISSMVLEHLDTPDETRYLTRSREVLAPGGRSVLFVPASPKHWGVEDEIAGHFRRYTASGLRSRLTESGFRVLHIAGLTFPLSNLLLPVSNRLVARAEGDKSTLSMEERTMQSGNRHVEGKTSFPPAARVVLNDLVMMPFHLLQMAFRSSERALVLYAEADHGGKMPEATQ